jgi:hypothetical protein
VASGDESGDDCAGSRVVGVMGCGEAVDFGCHFLRSGVGSVVGFGADCVSDGAGASVGVGATTSGATGSFSAVAEGDFGCHFFRSTDGTAGAGTGIAEGWASTMGAGAMGAAGI